MFYDGYQKLYGGYRNLPGAPGNIAGAATPSFDISSLEQDQGEMAGYLTDSDRNILYDHAKTLQRAVEQGNRSAARELRQMNERYAPYGWAFGNTKLPGI